MTRELALQRAEKLREVLLDHGVPEVSIELQTGRTGGWNGLDPVAVMSHHIASNPRSDLPTPGLSLVKRGRSDLPGPLANGTAGVDLVYRILCLDWANHPGYGGPWTVRGPCGSFTIPRDNARGYAWGTEYEGGYSESVWDATYTNRRTGKRMTFREFMGRANAGLCEGIWLPGLSSRGRYDVARDAEPGALAGYHGEHKTWAPGRKPDRLGYTTDSGRAEVRRYDLKEDPMAQYDEQLDELVKNSRTAIRKLDRAAAADVRFRKEMRGRAQHIAQVGRAGKATVEQMAEQLDRLVDELPEPVEDEAS